MSWLPPTVRSKTRSREPTPAPAGGPAVAEAPPSEQAATARATTRRTLEPALILARTGLPQRAPGPRHEGGLDEGFEVPVHHPVDVPDLELRPVVLHHAVGVHHVRADLAAEGDVLLGRLHRVELLPALLHLEIVEARLEDLHGHLAVADLAALVLAGDDDPRRDVGDAYGGIGDVDVLAAS